VSPQVLDIRFSGMCGKEESWAKCLSRGAAPGSQNYQTKPNFWLLSCRDAVALAIVMGPADGTSTPDAY
jgi:hypothetical protein